VNIGAGVICGVAGVGVGLPTAGFCLGYSAQGCPRVSVISSLRQSPALPGTVAAVAGVASGLVAARLGWSPVLPAFLLAAVVGVTLAVTDLRVRRLSFVLSGIVYGGCAVNLCAEAISAQDYGPLGRAAAAGLAVSAAFLGVALALPGQLGLGDVVLAGWIASTLGWLGWSNLVLGLVTGVVFQLVAVVTLVASHRASRSALLPMGPALWIGWLMGVLLAT
jgi:leader peptidase (prepilin peptidase) / N-methyltransferase